MKKLLIVDDEERIRSLIKKYALYEGFAVIDASGGKIAVEIMKNNDVDLVILDVMMPDKNGFDVAREIRAFSDAPIIMLTAKSEELDKIRGFTCGVDDYVTKPFSPRELMLRVNAILKRRTTPSATTYTIDNMHIDTTSRLVSIDGERISLSLKEYELLLYMVKNRGVAIPRDRFISEIWGYDYDGFDRTLDTHIKLLRKALGRMGEKIQTVRGVGYRFEKED